MKRHPAGKLQASCVHTRVLLTAFVSALIVLSFGCSLDRKGAAEKSLQRAEKYLAKGNSDSALIELRRALQLNPNLAKAHLELGKLQLDRGVLPAAFHEFAAAMKIDPENHDAHIWVTEILLRAGNFTEAKGEAELIQKKWPSDRLTNLLLAESLIGLHNYNEGRTLIDKTLAANPDDVRALLDLAILDLSDKKTQSAAATLTRALALDPKSAVAVQLLSQTYESGGEFQAAEQILKEAVSKSGDDVASNLRLANFYGRHQRLKDAEDVYRHVSSVGKEAEHRDILAEFYLATARLSDAEAEFRRIVAADDKNWEAWRGLAAACQSQGRSDEARGILDRLIAKNPRDWQTLTLRGRVSLEKRDFDHAVADLEEAKKIDPDRPEPQFELARAFAARGQAQEAQSALQDVLRKYPDFLAARTLLADLYVSGGEFDDAITELNKIVAPRPRFVAPYLLLSHAYLGKGNLQMAEESIKGLTEATRGQGRVLALETMTEIRLRQGRSAEAAKLAGQALDAAPTSVKALYQLGLSYINRHQPNEALAAVQSRLNRSPGWTQGYEVLGQLALQAGILPKAEEAFTKVLSADPKSTVAAAALGDVYAGQKRLDLARAQFEKASQIPSLQAYAMLRLGQLYEMSQDFEKAKTSYEKAIAANPENDIAKNNLAWVYSEHGGNIDVALKLAQEAREKAPANPNIADTLGWIYVKKGSYDAAVHVLQESLAQEPNNALFHYHLGTAYFKSGQFPEAKKQLEAALGTSGFTSSTEAQQMLSVIAAR